MFHVKLSQDYSTPSAVRFTFHFKEALRAEDVMGFAIAHGVLPYYS